jgi:DinB family protein
MKKKETMVEPAGFVPTFVSLYRRLHSELRTEVSGLGREALTWTPGPDTNSISTIVIHLLGSEEEVLRIVGGVPSDPDRAAEFTERVAEAAQLVSRIDRAGELVGQLGSGITEEDLTTLRVRPSAVKNRTRRSGMFWLLNSYGHAREHLAHLQLTKQLLLRGERAG